MAISLSIMNIESKKHWWKIYKANKGQKISPEKEDARVKMPGPEWLELDQITERWDHVHLCMCVCRLD